MCGWGGTGDVDWGPGMTGDRGVYPKEKTENNECFKYV